jgi:hypothetical protein
VALVCPVDEVHDVERQRLADAGGGLLFLVRGTGAEREE